VTGSFFSILGPSTVSLAHCTMQIIICNYIRLVPSWCMSDSFWW